MKIHELIERLKQYDGLDYDVYIQSYSNALFLYDIGNVYVEKMDDNDEPHVVIEPSNVGKVVE